MKTLYIHNHHKRISSTVLLICLYILLVPKIYAQPTDCSHIASSYTHDRLDTIPAQCIERFLSESRFDNDSTTLQAYMDLFRKAVTRNDSYRARTYGRPIENLANQLSIEGISEWKEVSLLSLETYNKGLSLIPAFEKYATYFKKNRSIITIIDPVELELFSHYSMLTIYEYQKKTQDFNRELEWILRFNEAHLRDRNKARYYYYNTLLIRAKYRVEGQLSAEDFDFLDDNYKKLITALTAKYPGELYQNPYFKKSHFFERLGYLDELMLTLYIKHGKTDALDDIQKRMAAYPTEKVCDLHPDASIYNLFTVDVSCVTHMLNTTGFNNDSVSLAAYVIAFSHYRNNNQHTYATQAGMHIDSLADVLDMGIYTAWKRFVELETEVEEGNGLRHLGELLELADYFAHNKDFKILMFPDYEYISRTVLLRLYGNFGLKKDFAKEAQWCIDYSKKLYASTSDQYYFQSHLIHRSERILYGDTDTISVQDHDSLATDYDTYLQYVTSNPLILKPKAANLNFINGHIVLGAMMGHIFLLHDNTEDAQKAYESIKALKHTQQRYAMYQKGLHAHLLEADRRHAQAAHLYRSLLDYSMQESMVLDGIEYSKRLVHLHMLMGAKDSAVIYQGTKDSLEAVIQNNIIQASLQKEKVVSVETKVVYDYTYVYIALLLLGVFLFLLYRYPKAILGKLTFSDITRSARAKERKRISSDLHDNVGSLLTGLRLRMQEKLKDAKDSGFQEVLDELTDIHEEVRKISHDIHDSDFHLHRLDVMIKQFLDKMGQSTSMRIEGSIYVSKHLEKLSADAKISIYRILQELVNNALKYAQAKEVYVSLSCDEEALILIVEDDGIGMDLDAVAETEGIGLRTCQERCVEIGATLAIDSQLGRGTIVTLNMPL